MLDKTKLTLGLGFTALLLLMGMVISFGLTRMESIQGQIQAIVHEHNVKTRLILDMRDNIRERQVGLRNILLSKDPFEQDDERSAFNAYAQNFIATREILEAMPMVPQEVAAHRKLRAYIHKAQDFQQRTIELAVEQDQNEKAIRLMSEQGKPWQDKVVEQFRVIVHMQREASERAVQEATLAYREALRLMFLTGSTACIVGLFIAGFVAHRITQQTKEVEEERTKFKTLFDTHLDAVLLFDRSKIWELNPAAEKLFHITDREKFMREGLCSHCPKQQPNGSLSQALMTSLIGSASAGEGLAFEWTFQRSEQDFFPADVTLHGVQLAGHDLLQAVIRDITERKRAEQEIQNYNDTLERTVQHRTRALQVANQTLQESNDQLEAEVISRKQAEQQLRDSQQEVTELAHRAGMSEVITGVLHNIGNILNSIKTTGDAIYAELTESRLAGFSKANQLLSQNSENIGNYLSSDPKGKKLPLYYLSLENFLKIEQTRLLEHADKLRERIIMMADVISAQQDYASSKLYSESVAATVLIENSLRLFQGTALRYHIEIERRYQKVANIKIQKVKLVQVLVNLFKNAKEAMDRKKEKHLLIEIIPKAPKAVIIRISDNGEGIKSEHLDKIFTHGFTTKETGHGFGLHFSANAMTEMGGQLTVESKGSGQGAVFTLICPASEPTKS